MKCEKIRFFKLFFVLVDGYFFFFNDVCFFFVFRFSFSIVFFSINELIATSVPPIKIAVIVGVYPI